MQSGQDEFARFLATREQAAIAFLNGDAAPLNGVVANNLPVSFFEPGGAVVVGNADVRERYRKNAEPFSRGSYSFQILQSESAANIGYVVGIQRSSVQISGRTEPVPLNLRVTEIFRRESGSWRLVHRHADRVAE